MANDWLHISPTSGTGSTQLGITADTNNTGFPRKAKIIITAGTMSKTIEVVQNWVVDGDIVSTYQQTQSGVKILSQILNDIDKVVLQGNGKTQVFSGTSLSSLTATTVYTFDSETPTAITAAVTFKNSFDGLTRGMYSNLPDMLTLSFNKKATSLYSVQHNPRLKYLHLYSGITTWGVALCDCPALEEIDGESPMIYDSRTLVSTANTKYLCGFAPYGIEEYEIPNIVKGVGSNVFEFTESAITITPLTIKTIKIPDTITGYSPTAFASKFTNFNSLETITLPETKSFYIIENGMFSGCTNLKNFTVNSNVIQIHSNAFNGCSSITSITVNAESGITISANTFQGIATGGTLYHPEGTDYSSWLSNDQYYLGYYLWNDGTNFNLLNVSTYILQFSSGATGTSNAQSVFINATRGDYQFNISDNQSQTASTQTDWLVVSGTPSAGNVEFKIYPSTTASTQRNCYIHIVEGGRIWATITVEQSSVIPFQLENVSTYFLQFSSGQTGSSNYQSVFVTANKADYQINISDNQTTTASTQTSWLTVSGTPASGYTEFKVFPTATSSTQRNCYIHIVEGGQIWATITVVQLDSIPSSVLNVSPTSLIFSGTANDSYSAQTLTVQSTVPYTFSQGADWFTVSGTPNVGNTTLKVYPISNNWNSARNSYIQFFYEGGYKNVSIEQKKANKPRMYTASTYIMGTKLAQSGCNGQAIAIVPATGGGHDFYITSNQSWITVSYAGGGPASWWDFSGTSSTDYAAFYDYVVEDNETGYVRDAKLSLFYDGELITN